MKTDGPLETKTRRCPPLARANPGDRCRWCIINDRLGGFGIPCGDRNYRSAGGGVPATGRDKLGSETNVPHPIHGSEIERWSRSKWKKPMLVRRLVQDRYFPGRSIDANHGAFGNDGRSVLASHDARDSKLPCNDREMRKNAASVP